VCDNVRLHYHIELKFYLGLDHIEISRNKSQSHFISFTTFAIATTSTFMVEYKIKDSLFKPHEIAFPQSVIIHPLGLCNGQFLTPWDYDMCPSNLTVDAWHVALSKTSEEESTSIPNSEQFRWIKERDQLWDSLPLNQISI